METCNFYSSCIGSSTTSMHSFISMPWRQPPRRCSTCLCSWFWPVAKAGNKTQHGKDSTHNYRSNYTNFGKRWQNDFVLGGSLTEQSARGRTSLQWLACVQVCSVLEVALLAWTGIWKPTKANRSKSFKFSWVFFSSLTLRQNDVLWSLICPKRSGINEKSTKNWLRKLFVWDEFHDAHNSEAIIISACWQYLKNISSLETLGKSQLDLSDQNDVWQCKGREQCLDM